MLKTELSPQLNTQLSKLLEIAISVTNNRSLKDSSSVHLSQVKDYQIWRDPENIAIVNSKTQQLIVFGSLKSEFYHQQPDSQNITSQTLWKNIQHYSSNLNLAISAPEITSAWKFFKPLDPVFSSLNQIRTVEQKNENLDIVSQKNTKALKESKNSLVHRLNNLCSFSRNKLSTTNSMV
ncbi:hypothetical protein [Pleurocapsa sp. PCC 7319]|uniref:hypothetical protein n=1 Tax=Pleurocapsa sp. PCC 7319 TaxID=118161 RepID=UPI000346A362|nr:hypothetical protein [Pleurocapsa sp. PCC 7319]